MNIHDILDTNAVETLVDKWSQFIEDNKMLVDNPAPQFAEIKTFIEINFNNGRVTDAQSYLMGKSKQFQSTYKPERLQVVVDKYIDFVFGAQDACRIAKSCGYRIRDAPIAKRDIETADLYSTSVYNSDSGYGIKGRSSKGPSTMYHKGTPLARGHPLTLISVPYSSRNTAWALLTLLQRMTKVASVKAVETLDMRATSVDTISTSTIIEVMSAMKTATLGKACWHSSITTNPR